MAEVSGLRSCHWIGVGRMQRRPETSATGGNAAANQPNTTTNVVWQPATGVSANHSSPFCAIII